MPENIKEETIARINNVHNRVLMRNNLQEKPFGFELLLKIDHFVSFVKSIILNLKEEELSEINILCKNAEIVDNMLFENGIKKTKQTQIKELELLGYLYEQTVSYYNKFFGYNPTSSLIEENPVKISYMQLIESAEGIKRRLYQFQNLAMKNNELLPIIRTNTIKEFRELIKYINILIECIEKKINDLTDQQDDINDFDTFNSIIIDFIAALNNSNELFDIQCNTYSVKCRIHFLAKDQKNKEERPIR